ncbi:MAG: archaeal heat shock protein Hsp20 [Candidatus Odinarchaeia archaeon]
MVWFDDIFKEIRKSFKEVEEMFDRMFRTSLYREGKFNEPLFYGISLHIGPDGKPVIDEFGNVKPASTGFVEESVRTPYTDVMVDEKEGKITVIAEMPGVRKEDIELKATDRTLTIKAETEKRKYFKKLDLGIKVDPNSAVAEYKNGILEVTLKSKEPLKPKEHKIEIK